MKRRALRAIIEGGEGEGKAIMSWVQDDSGRGSSSLNTFTCYLKEMRGMEVG